VLAVVGSVAERLAGAKDRLVVPAADAPWQPLLLTVGAVVAAAAAGVAATVVAGWQAIGGHAVEGHVGVTNDTVEATCNVLGCNELPAVTMCSREGTLGATIGEANAPVAPGITAVTSHAATGGGTETVPPV